jgi:hypothetical protein
MDRCDFEEIVCGQVKRCLFLRQKFHPEQWLQTALKACFHFDDLYPAFGHYFLNFCY